MEWLLLDLLGTVAVIWIVGSFSRTFQVDGMGAALTLALVLMVVGWLITFPVQMALPTVFKAVLGSTTEPTGRLTPDSPWHHARYIYLTISFVINAVLLCLAGLMTPGVEVRGVVGILIAATLMSAWAALIPYLLALSGG